MKNKALDLIFDLDGPICAIEELNQIIDDIVTKEYWTARVNEEEKKHFEKLWSKVLTILDFSNNQIQLFYKKFNSAFDKINELEGKDER